MARTGKVTLYEGIGKTSKKPYTALRLEVGKFTKLYFDLTPLERDYVSEYLKGGTDADEKATVTASNTNSDDGKIDLENDDTADNGLFD